MAVNCVSSRNRRARALRLFYERSSEDAVNSAPAIPLLLVDDHVMFREGLARSLEREPGLTIVGQCSSSAEALALLRSGPTVVLLDVDLGMGRALEFVEGAHKAGFEGKILVVTAGISGQEVVQL